MLPLQFKSPGSPGQSIPTVATNRLRRPVSLPPRQPVLRCLAVEIGSCLDKLRPIYVVESVDVDHGISSPLDAARYDRDRAARQADMKICSFGSEPISRHARVVGDPQLKTAPWMRGPGSPVLRT